MNFRKVNNLMGWITGGIAYVVYLLTMERTVSFWDCGEFLACAYKLEVGHSPGAPFFMLMQRLFGIISGGPSGAPSMNAAMFINSFSALVSALTILFLFWTITHMARKLVVREDEVPNGTQTSLIMGAGLVGGLAYTFSDTFWFSAVEAEVYAFSSVFTAIVFWAILKWEEAADNRYADRWLVLIAYLMGLSIGVHLLNLLTIPAIAMVYYFRRYKTTTAGTIWAFVIGCGILGLVQFGIIQGLPIIASKFDLMFVNSLGLPVNSGALFAILLVCVLITWLLMLAKRRGWYLLHTGMLCFTFIVIGFSSYIVPVIRSKADVPVDMTNPDNALRVVSYVQREQFGAQPLLYGPDFDAGVVETKVNGYQYEPMEKDGKTVYEKVGEKLTPVYEPDKMRVFPRIWDNNNPSHTAYYRAYLDLGENQRPTSADNFKFFFNYQLNWMWWRYFMWNYVGRQGDVQGQPGPRNGNWVSGIKPIDKMLGVGDLDLTGKGISDNRARNELYFLPFILGIMGLVYQFNRDRKDGIIVTLLFFFTGIAVVLYLNNTPLQPRERDYAYAGSTYAFAIWIGLGVLMAHQWIQKLMKGRASVYAATTICLLAVPVLMAAKEWDDHDRSNKSLARATAYNALMSCAPNAVLFTFGDNDTYPLWYLQEVEGIRTDVRVVNMSLLGIDWYIDQLNYKVNKADAVPMIWKKEQYIGDRRNYIPYFNNGRATDPYVNLSEVVRFFSSDDPAYKFQFQNGGGPMNYMPTRNMFLPPTDKSLLVSNGLLSAADSAIVSTDMRFSLGGRNIYTKDALAVLNIVAAVAAEGWKRPIYFGAALPGDNYAGLNDYLKLEGVVYRLVPYTFTDPLRKNPQENGFVDADKSYDLFMNTYSWGGAERDDVYFDEKNRIMFQSYRYNAPRIAEELVRRGRREDAVRLLDRLDKQISQSAFPYNPYTLEGFDPSAYFLANSYYVAGATEQARKVSNSLAKNLEADLNWILSLNERTRESMVPDVQRDLGIINALSDVARRNGDTAAAQQLSQQVMALEQKARNKMDLAQYQ